MIFIGLAVVEAVYNFKNATSKNHYSEYDITEGHEEVDPLNERFGNPYQEVQNDFQNDVDDATYCPYCGVVIGSDFKYCHECGKKLPW